MKKIEKILLELGVKPNTRGFQYIPIAVEIVKKKRGVSMTCVFKLIANQVGSTWQSVERATRHSVKNMDTESDAWEKYIHIRSGYQTTASVVYALSANDYEKEE